MNLSFDEQQEMMRKSFKSFLEDHYPVSEARKFMDEEKDSDPKLWMGIADLGIPGILISESYGGLGLTPIDQLVIQEEAGRFLTPAPVKANAVASYLLNNADNAQAHEEVLSGICEGTLICTIGFMENTGKWDEPSITRTHAEGSSYILNGTKIGVPFAAMSDYAVVSALDSAGEYGFYLVPLKAEGVSVRRVKTMDATQPWYEVRFEHVRLDQDAKLADGKKRLMERAMELGAIFTCAESVGGMERILSMTTEYAKERIQFGKPIGSFQAIKHKLADMLVGVEKSKALTYYAAVELEEGADTRAMSLASAKVLCAETYHFLAREGIQIHGGMGFTWEHDMHLYLRRAILNQTEFGDPGRYRKVIRQALDLSAV